MRKILQVLSLALAAGALAPVAAVAQERGGPGDDSRGKLPVDSARGGASSAATSGAAAAVEPQPAAPAEARPSDNFYRSQREIPWGNWGFGYELSIRFSLSERRVYSEDFDTPREILNQVAFIRYGMEGAVGRPYIRVGALDTSRLGYGQVLAYYDNTPYGSTSPKRGLEAGMNFGRAGFEVITGNLERLEVVGARGYVKPLRGLVGGKLGDIQLGLTGATDFAPGAGYTEMGLPQGARVRSGSVAGQRYPRPTVYGGDVTVPLIRREGTELLTYSEVARLRGGGHGGVLALQITQQVRHSRLIARIEHREVSNGFRPAYFDHTYEQERFAIIGGEPTDLARPVNTRYRLTLNSISGGPGAFAETRLMMPRWSIWSFYARNYRDPRSGWLHVELDSRTALPRVSAHVWFDKWRIDGARDLLRLDDRAAIQAAAAFRLYRNAHIFALSRWSFVPESDPNGVVTGYRTNRYGERRVTLRVPF